MGERPHRVLAAIAAIALVAGCGSGDSEPDVTTLEGACAVAVPAMNEAAEVMTADELDQAKLDRAREKLRPVAFDGPPEIVGAVSATYDALGSLPDPQAVDDASTAERMAALQTIVDALDQVGYHCGK